MDRDKVIKGLECVIDKTNFDFKYCHSCEYRKDIDHFQYVCDADRCIVDAIALLKAQDPVEPIQDMVGDALFWVCGKCGHDLTSSDWYCANCGRAVKWDG